MTRAFYTRDIERSFVAWVSAQAEATLAAAVHEWQALLVEASFRRFFRIHTGAGTLVAMHAPPAREDTGQFVRIAELFKSHGIGVPLLHAHDLDRGFVLMEDLGDESLELAYARGAAERALALAIETLVRVQRIEDDQGIVPAYAASRFEMELGIFSEWFVGGLLGETPPTWYAELAEPLIENAVDQPQCPIHRDFHCRNLLIKPSGDLGVVDFQDALIGPVTYDLASLLGDCYYELDAHQVSTALRTYRQAARETNIPTIQDEARFRLAFDKMVIQRQLKAVGIFSRLWLRDGKSSHLESIAPVLVQLARRCQRIDIDDIDMVAPLARAIEDDWLPKATARVAQIER